VRAPGDPQENGIPPRAIENRFSWTASR